MGIKRVGIIGSGIMGSGIAEVAAKAGHDVVLRSRSASSADAMVTSLEKWFPALEGRILFELEGEEPREIVAGQAFWEPGADVVHYQVANLDSRSWSRFLAVCICAPGVDMITMLEPEEVAARDHLRHPSVRQHAG